MKRCICFGFVIIPLMIGGVYFAYRSQIQQTKRDSELLLAVRRYDTPRAIRLLEEGANPDARIDRDAPRSFREYVRQLVRNHRNRNEPRNSPTALLLSLECRSVAPGSSFVMIPEENPTLVRALLEHGADPDAVDVNKDTALIIASSYKFTETARLLVKAGANVNHISLSAPGTALAFAAQRGCSEIMELLISHGANVNLADGSSTVPLNYAADQGHTEAARKLIDGGADVNCCDDHGFTPLMSAAYLGRYDCVKLLLSRSADPNRIAKGGNTALSLAREDGYDKVVRLLKTHGASR